MRSVLLLLAWAFFAGAVGLAAQDANPFDLQHRLPKTIRTAVTPTNVNPFDVVAHRAPGVASEMTASGPTVRKPLLRLPRRNNLSLGGLFGVLVGTLVLFTFSVGANRSAVGKSWRSFLNENALTIAQRDASGLAGNTPYFLLYLNFLLNAGIFIFLIIQSLTDSAYNNFPFLMLCLGGAALVFLSKHAFVRVAGWLLPVKSEASRYNFLITIFNCVLGLFLVPFNFMIAFLLEYKEFLLFWVVGLAILFYGYRSVRSASIASTFLSGNQFHFLLYLCTVEIAPLMILIKTIMLQVG